MINAPSPEQAPQPDQPTPSDDYHQQFTDNIARINHNLRTLFPDSYPDFVPTEEPANAQPERLYTAEELEDARREVAEAFQSGQAEEPKLDTAKPEVFEEVALASRTLFVEGTNLPSSSKDKDRIADSYENAGNGRYPIPNMRAVRNSYDNHELEPVSRLERAVRRVAVSGYLTLEEFANENQKRSNFNKKAMELMNELQGTGNDGQIRALWATEVRPGVWRNIHTGEEFSATDVADARRKWFQDPSHFAAAFWYEIHKSASEDEFNNTLERVFEMLNEAASRPNQSFAGTRFSNRDIAGILLGVGYAHKGIHQTLKHMNAGVNSDGLWEYRGVKSIKLITELSTKLRPHEVANLSPIDVGNIAFITQNALMASIEYKNKPKSPEFIKSQLILQRAAKLISDMRYASTVDPEGSDAEIQKLRQTLDARGLLSKPAIRIGKEDGKLYLDGQPLRSGASSLSSAGWEQVAGFTDVACELFPNIKYIDRNELTTLDRTASRAINDAITKAKKEWVKDAENAWKERNGGTLNGFDKLEALADFDEGAVIRKQSFKAAEIIKNKDKAPGYFRTKRLRKAHRGKLQDERKDMVTKNNKDLKESRDQRRAREKAEWLDPSNR